MKNFLGRVIIFIVLLTLLFVFVIGVFGSKFVYYRIGSYGHMFSRIKEIPQQTSPDILFLGSSHSYRGFDPRIFSKQGITTFNLGSSSQTPKQTEVLLKKYLVGINPKMIIFEVFPGVFQNDGIESTTDLISNDHIDFEICKLAIKTGNVRVISTLIYGLFQEYVFKTRASFNEDIIKDGDMYVSGGYVEKREFTHYNCGNNPLSHSTIIIRNDQLKAFEKCVKLIKETDIPFLLVEAPVPQCTYQRLTNHEEFYKVISSYGVFVDFNSILHLDDTCFYDSNHLSQSGVNLFDDCLIRVLDTIELNK